MKTLHEVTQIVGMTRRVIQEYEKAGLATAPTATNKYSHLLYADKEIDRLWQIRFYRELGYGKNEMKAVFNNPHYNRKEALSFQIAQLEKKKKHLESLIETANLLKEMDVPISAIRFGSHGLENLPYDTLVPVIVAAFNAMDLKEPMEQSFVAVLTEEDENYWFETLDKVMVFFKEDSPYDDDSVQVQICALHHITAKVLSDSIFLFKWNNLNFAPGAEIASEIDDIYGPGSAEYLFQATCYYCTKHEDNPTDRNLIDALNNIENLGRKKYTTGSEEVQAQVKRIHEFFSNIPAMSQAAHLSLLNNIGNMFGSKTYKELIDNGAERGVSWFISRAIQIYCTRLKENEFTEDTV